MQQTKWKKKSKKKKRDATSKRGCRKRCEKAHSHEKPRAINLNQSPKKEKLTLDCRFIVKGYFIYYSVQQQKKKKKQHEYLNRDGRSMAVAATFGRETTKF